MIICVNCGVELDDGLKMCPLCGKDPAIVSSQEQHSFNYPSAIVQLHRREIRKSLWELSGIIAFSAIAVCTIVDLIIIHGLAWSLYADIALTASWIILTLFLHAYRRPFIILPGLVLVVLATLLSIDMSKDGIEWFFSAGLPLTIASFFSAIIIAFLYRLANLKGLNIIAVAFMVLSGFCVLTEMILDDYLEGYIKLRWSLIAAISIFPVALILLFYHYRLKKGNMLDSFLHI